MRAVLQGARRTHRFVPPRTRDATISNGFVRCFYRRTAGAFASEKIMLRLPCQIARFPERKFDEM